KIYAWLVDRPWNGEAVALDRLVTELRNLFDASAGDARLARRLLEEMKDEVLNPTTRADLVGDLYRLLRILRVHEWDLLEPLSAARAGTLAQFTQVLADYEHARQRSRPNPESRGEFVGGTNRGAWYYRQLYWYLKYYAQEEYADFEGEEHFTEDVVDLTTIHRAKGLDWPVVFVPCLSNQRFPSRKVGSAREWLVPQHLLSQPAKERYEGALVDEQRLFYVAVTRAKDCLFLSTFRRINR